MERLPIKMVQAFRMGVVPMYGIFKSLYDYDSSLTTPLLSGFVTSDNYLTLDIDYLIGSSADKWISPLFYKFLQTELESNGYDIIDLFKDTINDNDLSAYLYNIFAYNENGLIKVIHNRFASKWKHIWDALNTAYNPLENYSMLEERTPDITKERTLDTTDERTPDLTKTTNGTGTTSTDSQTGIFGFNSAESNPSGTIDGNQTDTITDRTETETGTDTSTQSGTITDTESGKETIERSGNIGVTTSQQMLQSEFEVRKYDFYKEIYKDIDSILCLKIY